MTHTKRTPDITNNKSTCEQVNEFNCFIKWASKIVINDDGNTCRQSCPIGALVWWLFDKLN